MMPWLLLLTCMASDSKLLIICYISFFCYVLESCEPLSGRGEGCIKITMRYDKCNGRIYLKWK